MTRATLKTKRLTILLLLRVYSTEPLPSNNKGGYTETHTQTATWFHKPALFLVYFPHFEKMKLGLWDRVAVCVGVCIIFYIFLFFFNIFLPKYPRRGQVPGSPPPTGGNLPLTSWLPVCRWSTIFHRYSRKITLIANVPLHQIGNSQSTPYLLRIRLAYSRRRFQTWDSDP
jgi:hypothetical protein